MTMYAISEAFDKNGGNLFKSIAAIDTEADVFDQISLDITSDIDYS